MIDALNGGDLSAFDALYARYRDRVARLALRFTGNDADALDVLQETFVYFFRKFPGFVLTSQLTTFLYPSVRNLSAEARRKRLRAAGIDIDLTESLLAPSQHPTSAGAREELAAAMAMLPQAQRDVVLLRFVDDLTIDEIAAAVDVPAGTVKSRLHHAIAALRADPRVQKYFEA